MIPRNAKWTQNGVTIAGGRRQGNAANQLSSPNGLYVDEDQTIFIADTQNGRIEEWKLDTESGQVVAGGHEKGWRLNQLTKRQTISLSVIKRIDE
jgi:sugar lactone lactonase YvrE